MNNEYIISVLDYSNGQVDIFMTSLPDDWDTTMVTTVIERRGHRMDDCEWMAIEVHKFRLNIDI